MVDHMNYCFDRELVCPDKRTALEVVQCLAHTVAFQRHMYDVEPAQRVVNLAPQDFAVDDNGAAPLSPNALDTSISPSHSTADNDPPLHCVYAPVLDDFVRNLAHSAVQSCSVGPETQNLVISVYEPSKKTVLERWRFPLRITMGTRAGMSGFASGTGPNRVMTGVSNSTFTSGSVASLAVPATAFNTKLRDTLEAAMVYTVEKSLDAAQYNHLPAVGSSPPPSANRGTTSSSSSGFFLSSGRASPFDYGIVIEKPKSDSLVGGALNFFFGKRS